MRPRALLASLLLASGAACAFLAAGAPQTTERGDSALRSQLAKIRLPRGFAIGVFAENVPGARSLALGANGTVFVGTRGEGRVYALPDRNNDHRADAVEILAEGLNIPNGVAFRNGSLFVAEINRVVRFDSAETRRKAKPVLVNDGFPSDRSHGWKFIRFGPDGKLYVPVGGPCNVCERSDKRYATIMRMNADGSGLEVYASGVRNSVGFDWQPSTGALWFTDNGRDMLGDDIPPDELNTAPSKGMHFGFPYFHGNAIPDPEFSKGKKAADYRTPAITLGPHVAALGMRFYAGSMFPAEYRNQVFIAEHGSWNRSSPLGYRLSLVRLRENKAVSYETFAEGWLQDGRAWGRPVDLLVMPDGSLLVSDDHAGAVYRISRSAK